MVSINISCKKAKYQIKAQKKDKKRNLLALDGLTTENYSVYEENMTHDIGSSWSSTH